MWVHTHGARFRLAHCAPNEQQDEDPRECQKMPTVFSLSVHPFVAVAAAIARQTPRSLASIMNGSDFVNLFSPVLSMRNPHALSKCHRHGKSRGPTKRG